MLEGAETVYTYNGKRFDIPVIAEKTGLNLMLCDCGRNIICGKIMSLLICF